MSNQTTQSKLAECRVCRDAGFPNQMIGFVKTNKVKENGKPVWSLHNVDMTSHYHKSPTEKFQSIENDKPPARPSMTDVSVNTNVTDPTLIAMMSQIVDQLKLIALSNLATTEEERETIRARLLE